MCILSLLKVFAKNVINAFRDLCIRSINYSFGSLRVFISAVVFGSCSLGVGYEVCDRTVTSVDAMAQSCCYIIIVTTFLSLGDRSGLSNGCVDAVLTQPPA